MATGAAIPAFPSPCSSLSASQPLHETSPGGRLRKIALEEHFLVPEFLDYFAETFPNINPAIRKFGTDYPYERTDLAAEFIEKARISETEQAQVASGNARRILKWRT